MSPPWGEKLDYLSYYVLVWVRLSRKFIEKLRYARERPKVARKLRYARERPRVARKLRVHRRVVVESTRNTASAKRVREERKSNHARSTYGRHLPHITSVARRVLAQPVCASAAERNWSVYGQIKSALRSRLAHAVADKLVYVHEALHLKHKLQKASYTPHVEKWDSDSDSDESDDEDDLKV